LDDETHENTPGIALILFCLDNAKPLLLMRLKVKGAEVREKTKIPLGEQSQFCLAHSC
jgi:hypothetical protein